MKLSIIVPVYNEESTLKEVLKRILSVKYPIDYEVIIINDGSTDHTLKELGKIKSKKIRMLSNKKNEGKGVCIALGLKNATGDILIIQDADSEYDPEQIPYLINPIIRKETNVVYGSRFLGKIENMKISNRIGNLFLTKFTNLLFKEKLTDIETGYKAMTNDIAKKLDLKQKGFEVEAEITAKLLKRKEKILELPIVFNARRKGKKITWIDGFKTAYFLLKFYL